MRTCGICLEPKALSEFGKNAALRDGLHRYCRRCVADKARSYRAANREKVRKYKRAWSKTEKGRALKRREKARNKEKYAARERRRREEKPQEIRAQWQRWADRNREHVREVNRRYRLNHPGKAAEYSRRWRYSNPTARGARALARRRDAESAEMAGVMLRDLCSYCGSASASIDHIQAIATGGENHWSNFTGACLACNSGKRDRSLLAYLLLRRAQASRSSQPLCRVRPL